MTLARAGIALLVVAAGPLRAQDPATKPAPTIPQVTFSFDRKGLPVPTYQLLVSQDGTGVYQGQEVPQSGGAAVAVALAPQDFRRPITLSSASVGRIFTLTQKLNHFNLTCASKAKNIADTGTKKLTYSASDASGSCTYNYTENKDVQALTDIFLGIAETMDEGRELDRLHRYDRLGLDAAMKYFADEVSAGRALEVGTIAASLRSISDDTDVIQRVRTRADALLALVPGEGSSH